MKYLDLFAGYGGFSLGIQQAYEDLRADRESEAGTQSLSSDRGISGSPVSVGNGRDESAECIGFSEIDKFATQIYKKHFPTHKEYGDITKLDPATLPDFDLLTGGFPCQAFSIAGKRGGFSDTRGTLIFDVFRIIREKHPRWVLLENVKGLLSHEGGKTFRAIIYHLAELGYAVEWQVLNAKNFGVPQNRERVFIIGHLGGFGGRQVFPIGESGGERSKSDAQGNAYCLQAGNDKHRGTYVAGDVLQGIPDERPTIRRLTPTECERLMGLPDGWTEGVSDTQRYKLCGNGVVVPVVKEIISRLI